MAVFLSSLKKSGHLEQIHITICVVGSRKIPGMNDYVSSHGWDIFAPNLTIYGFDADTNACKEANVDIDTRKVDWNEKHLPLALWNSIGNSTLYVTEFPACSSLYPPSQAYIERFVGNSELIKLAYTLKIETTTLDTFCKSEGVNEVDFIQLDVQGGELSVLEGASEILGRGTLAIITEVEFTELYTGQPLFGDVDTYLRKQGFTLFDLCNMHHDGRRMPLASTEHPGSLVWSDAFYFRDLIREDLDTSFKTPERILKLACIADVLNFPDYTLELLTYLTFNYGSNRNYNFVNNIIESLARIPELVQEGLSTLPIIRKIREYSNGYNLQAISIKSESPLNEQVNCQQQAYLSFLLEEYSQAASLYEQSIEVEPQVKNHYWYLGLSLLLQGQEAEAQTTWFLGMADEESGKAEIWTAELKQVLQTEAERREALTDYSVAWALRQHIRELEPTDVNNLLQIIQLSINLGTFKYEDIASLGIIELLEKSQSVVDQNLLLQVLDTALKVFPNNVSVLAFTEACKNYNFKFKAQIDILLANRRTKYSYLDEETIIENYLAEIKPENDYCIDIAASDGLAMSNTYFLFERGWAGLAVEGDSSKFASLATNYAGFERVNLSKGIVTPENVVELLEAYQVPKQFAFLNLDIDGYDYFVLERILSSFRPSLICTEINESIPPPLKFTVKWDKDYTWAADHFFGQSICQLNILCQRHEYEIVELHYNNIFLVPKEINPSTYLTPQQAYKKGYLERIDRHQKFPWNAVIEEIHSLSPQEALVYLNKFFSKYEGKFICTI